MSGDSLRAQAFIIDGFLALILALALVQLLGTQQADPPDRRQVALSHACYDLTNAFYADSALYGNVSSSLSANSTLNASSVQLLRDRFLHYGQLLELSSVDFEVNGIQKEHIPLAGTPASVERCCFPIVANSDGITYIACLEVGA